jgi:hypothetical protein
MKVSVLLYSVLGAGVVTTALPLETAYNGTAIFGVDVARVPIFDYLGVNSIWSYLLLLKVLPYMSWS